MLAGGGLVENQSTGPEMVLLNLIPCSIQKSVEEQYP